MHSPRYWLGEHVAEDLSVVVAENYDNIPSCYPLSAYWLFSVCAGPETTRNSVVIGNSNAMATISSES